MSTLNGREKQIQDELDYWKSRCLDSEGKIDVWKNKCLDVEGRVDQLQHNMVVETKENVKTPEACPSDVVKELKQELHFINKGLQSVSEQFQVSQQYSRKNNVIINKGFKFLPNMNNWDFIHATVNELNYLFPSMTGPIHPIYIDDAHPLDKQTVIIKFSNRWVKNEVMRCKSDLNGTGLKITEHLTHHTLELITSAEKLVGPSNVWVYNTLVFARFEDTRYSIRTAHDLDVLASAVKNKIDPKVSMPSTSQHVSSTPLSRNAEGNPSAENSQEHCTDNTISDNTANDIPSQYNTEYINNYPALYNSLPCRNLNTKTSILHGRPFRNGRGRQAYGRARIIFDWRR